VTSVFESCVVISDGLGHSSYKAQMLGDSVRRPRVRFPATHVGNMLLYVPSWTRYSLAT